MLFPGGWIFGLQRLWESFVCFLDTMTTRELGRRQQQDSEPKRHLTTTLVPPESSTGLGTAEHLEGSCVELHRNVRKQIKHKREREE